MYCYCVNKLIVNSKPIFVLFIDHFPCLKHVITNYPGFIPLFEINISQYFWPDYSFFLTLSNKVEKCSCIRFVCLSVRPSVCLSACLSVRALTLVNILQMSWNWYRLFIYDIAWTVLKMVYIRLMVCLQRHTKVFRYIKA